MRLLDLRGQTWWFKIDIPKACRSHFGRTTYLENLRTADVRTAKQLRDGLEGHCRSLFHDVRSGKIVDAAALSAADRGSLWRQTLADLRRDPEANSSGPDGPSLYDIALDAAEEEAERLRSKPSGHKQAKEFTRAFTGKHPVDHFIEQFLSETDLADKTRNERRGLVRQFTAWAKDEDLGLLDIDRKAAGRYVQEKIAPRDRRTGKKHLTAVKTYWDYLKRRGHVEFEVSPWHEQLEPQRGRQGAKKEPERPFTAEEVRSLLYGVPQSVTKFDGLTREITIFGLLSGMREDEIVSLKVGDVIDGPEGMGRAFDLSRSKTDAGVRMVPVHPGLMGSLEKRTTNRKPTDLLFHEFDDMERASDTFGKRFKRYREARGVDDRRDGKRRSLVNFHSARRWFVAEAEHSGQPEATVGAVVGHAEMRQKGFTFGAYNAGGPSGAQRRAVVEAVQLPDRPRGQSATSERPSSR